MPGQLLDPAVRLPHDQHSSLRRRRIVARLVLFRPQSCASVCRDIPATLYCDS